MRSPPAARDFCGLAVDVFFESDCGERRQSQARGNGNVLARDRISMHAAVVSYVATSIDTGISVQDLFVPSFTRGADAIAMSRHRGGVHHEYNVEPDSAFRINVRTLLSAS